MKLTRLEVEKVLMVLEDSRWYMNYGNWTQPPRAQCAFCGEERETHEDCEYDEAITIMRDELEDCKRGEAE